MRNYEIRHNWLKCVYVVTTNDYELLALERNFGNRGTIHPTKKSADTTLGEFRKILDDKARQYDANYGL